jgi:glycosyltransferase involved in cell wall biosynthesis
MKLYFATNGKSSDLQGINTFLKVFDGQAARAELSSVNLEPVFLYSGVETYFDYEMISTNKHPDKSSLQKAVKKVVVASAFLSFLAVIKIGIIPAIKNALTIRKSREMCLCHSQDFYTPIFLDSKNTKIIMTVHSGDNPFQQVYYNFPRLKNSVFGHIMESIFKRAVEKCHAVIWLGRDSQDASNAKCNESFIIPNGIPDDQFQACPDIGHDSGLIYLISVGSLAYRKGFDLLINSVRTLSESERARLRIHIFGEGPERDLLAHSIRDNELEHILFLKGESRMINSELSKYDYFILCSREEGLPIALLEAMRSEIPCVVTNVGNISSMIDDNCCMKILPTTESITSALKSIIYNPQACSSYGKRGREEFMNKFTSNIMVKKYIEVYSKVIAC